MSSVTESWFLSVSECTLNLSRLRWLHMPEQVRYKLCLLVFKAVYGTAPDYLGELWQSNAEDAAQSGLRSAAHGDLQVPRSKTNFGDRPFAVAGPAWWNRLPATIRSSDTLQNFKNQLKVPFLMDHFLCLFHLSRVWTPLNWTPCYGD